MEGKLDFVTGIWRTITPAGKYSHGFYAEFPRMTEEEAITLVELWIRDRKEKKHSELFK